MAKLKNHGYIGTWKFEKPWEPGANTLAYYKFEGSLLNEATQTVDASFYGTGSYETIGSIQAVNLNNGAVAISSKCPAGDFTISRYGMFTNHGSNTWSGVFGTLSADNSKGGIHLQFMGIQFSVYNYPTSQGSQVDLSTGTDNNQRYYYTIVRSNGVLYFYVNNVQQRQFSCGANNNQSIQYYIGITHETVRYYKGYMSKFILENKAWTNEERTKYYNQTKKQYGL